MTAQPHDLDAERAVLGALLSGAARSDETAQVYAELEAESFYRAAHGHVFAACRELSQSDTEVDELTVANKLRERGAPEELRKASALAELANSTPTAANLSHYARIVRDLWSRRRLVAAAVAAMQAATRLDEPISQLLDSAAESISKISVASTRTEPIALTALVRREITHLEAQSAPDAPEEIGVRTGFYDLDAKLCGLRPGDLVIVAGRSSMGKTALAIEIARYAAVHEEVSTLVFSIEMEVRALTQRLLAGAARIDGQLLRKPKKLTQEHWSKLHDAANKLYTPKLHVLDVSSVTVLDIRAQARVMKARHGLGLIIVDYLQLVQPVQREQNREREISEISRGLKALAKELSVPVIALSQLNRTLEQRQNKRPILSDLRESGAIEQDADVVLFVYRPGYYSSKEPADVAEIIIAKQRNGPTGIVEVGWNAESVQFYNRRFA